jgi:hypothetical protein
MNSRRKKKLAKQLRTRIKAHIHRQMMEYLHSGYVAHAQLPMLFTDGFAPLEVQRAQVREYISRVFGTFEVQGFPKMAEAGAELLREFLKPDDPKAPTIKNLVGLGLPATD